MSGAPGHRDTLMWSIAGELDITRSEPVPHWCTSRDVGRFKCICRQTRPWFSTLPHGFYGAAPSLHYSTGRVESNPLIECNAPRLPLQFLVLSKSCPVSKSVVTAHLQQNITLPSGSQHRELSLGPLRNSFQLYRCIYPLQGAA